LKVAAKSSEAHSLLNILHSFLTDVNYSEEKGKFIVMGWSPGWRQRCIIVSHWYKLHSWVV